MAMRKGGGRVQKSGKGAQGGAMHWLHVPCSQTHCGLPHATANRVAAKPRDEAGEAFAAAVDELYATSFDGFVKLRGELAVRLRASGDPIAAKQIAAARKPTRSAWALNQVVRREPERIARIVETRVDAIASQKNGSADAIRDSARTHREAIAEAVRAARAVLEADGLSLPALQARRLGETLQAIAADDAARATLMAGRLTEDVAVDDPFAGLEAGPAQAHHARTPRDPAPSKREDPEEARQREAERARQERERHIAEARARIADLEKEHAAVRRASTEADRLLFHAQSDADKAKAALDHATRELAEAHKHLDALREPPTAAPSRRS
jgi:hypothetical protein